MTRVRTLEHIAEDRRHPGVQRAVERDLPTAALGPISTSSAAVPPDGDVHLHGVVEATGLDIVLTGTVTFPWEGECRRCLEDVQGTLEAGLQEVFAVDPVEGETWPFTGDAIDLAPVLREVVLLSLPLVPLCSEGCRGPDPARFPATVEGEGAADEHEEVVEEPPRDPRWAALDQLSFDE